MFLQISSDYYMKVLRDDWENSYREIFKLIKNVWVAVTFVMFPVYTISFFQIFGGLSHVELVENFPLNIILNHRKVVPLN